MHRFTLIVCAGSALLAAGRPAPDPLVTPSRLATQANAVAAQLPLRFEANQGQFDASVRYAARTSAYTLALTAQGASLIFPGTERVTLSLPGSSASPVVEALDAQSARTDYFVGARQNWHTGVANYSRVRYGAVYPGVDLIFYGRQDRLEYDFVLQPGADPDAIRMQFSGAGGVSITADGDLAFETPAGRIVQRKPVIYQQDPRSSLRRQISGKYQLLAGGVVGIRVAHYDRRQSLVIDPVIVYTTLIGGAGTETIAAIKYRSGLIYIAGATQAGDLVTTDRPYQNLTDAFLEIIDTTAAGGYSLKYFTYLGGSNSDSALSMDLDAAGFVYLVGATASTDFPVQGPAIQTTGALTTSTTFLSKLDPNQAGNTHSLVYSTYLGGTIGNDQANSVAVGPNGIAYILGTTRSADFPITDNAYAASLYGRSDCFLAQVDTLNGVLLYSSFFGSEVDDDGRAIVLAPNGLVYFAATTGGVQFPTAGPAYSVNPAGNYDIIIGAFDLTQSGVNSLVYSTYFGGSQNDEIRGIALDRLGRLILTGYTLSPDFPVTASTAVQSKYGGNGDAFVAVVDPRLAGSAFLLYSTFLGGSDGDVGYGVVGDSLGYLYVTGYTLSGDFVTTANVPQPNWGGGIDMFITRINPAIAGNAGIDYSTYIGLDSTIVGCCLALGPDGTLFVSGYTENYLPLLPAYTPIQSNYGGGYSDGFLLVLSPGAGLGGAKNVIVLSDPHQGTLTNGIPRRPRK